jgi:hypothetical protein
MFRNNFAQLCGKINNNTISQLFIMILARTVVNLYLEKPFIFILYLLNKLVIKNVADQETGGEKGCAGLSPADADARGAGPGYY